MTGVQFQGCQSLRHENHLTFELLLASPQKTNEMGTQKFPFERLAKQWKNGQNLKAACFGFAYEANAGEKQNIRSKTFQSIWLHDVLM